MWGFPLARKFPISWGIPNSMGRFPSLGWSPSRGWGVGVSISLGMQGWGGLSSPGGSLSPVGAGPGCGGSPGPHTAHLPSRSQSYTSTLMALQGRGESLAPPDTLKSHLSPSPSTCHPPLPVGFVLTPLWAFSCFLLLLFGIFLSIVATATSNTGLKQHEELFARTAAGDTYLGWGGWGWLGDSCDAHCPDG